MARPKTKGIEMTHADIRRFIESLKARTPCSDCGQKFPPECMDYDHVGDNKVMSVSKMIGSKHSVEEVFAEIDKCELVCANCHRIRTRGRWRSKPTR